MVKIFKVDLETREVTAIDNDYYIGVIGENNVTTLKFEYSAPVECTDIRIIFNTSTGSYVYKMLEEFTVPGEVLTDNMISFEIVHYYNVPIWKSKKVYVSLSSSADCSGENTFNELKEQWITEAQKPLTILINKLTESYKNINQKRSES